MLNIENVAAEVDIFEDEIFPHRTCDDGSFSVAGMILWNTDVLVVH